MKRINSKESQNSFRFYFSKIVAVWLSLNLSISHGAIFSNFWCMQRIHVIAEFRLAGLVILALEGSISAFLN